MSLRAVQPELVPKPARSCRTKGTKYLTLITTEDYTADLSTDEEERAQSKRYS